MNLNRPVQSDISIVIPVLNAASYLPGLLQAIEKQKQCALQEIILVDSQSTDNTVEIASENPNVRIVGIKNFSHGRARNLGVRQAKGEIVVFMTQDALPYDDKWLFKLVEPFSDDQVAATYSRQIPRQDAIFTERFFIETRFPDTPPVWRKKRNKHDDLTFEKVFFSNVSSAVRRSVILEYPFDEELIMSEDQQFSRDVLNAGFAVVYTSESMVVHSHNYKLNIVFKRYFDSVYSLIEIFPSHDLKTSFSIGIDYLLKEVGYVLKNHSRQLPYYFLYTTAKMSGTLLAHIANILPKSILRKISLHHYHWK